MASIKCKSCGRTYNYRNSDLCPKCGAYNRPPHRMRVGFDANGSVELQSDREFQRAARTPGPDDVCYEEQARKVRSSDSLIEKETLDALGNQLNKWGSRVEKWWTENSTKSAPVAKDSPLRDRRQAKKGGKSALAIVIALSVIASLIGSIAESCSSNLVAIRPEPDYSVPTEQIAPSAEAWGTDESWWTEEEKWDILSVHGVNELYMDGTAVYWQGQTIEIGGWEMTGDMGDSIMIVSVIGEDLSEAELLGSCYILWLDPDGTEYVFNPTRYSNGALIFEYIPTTVSDNTLIYLLMMQYEWIDGAVEEYYGTTAVSLMGDDTFFGDDAQDFTAAEATVIWSEEEQKALLDSHGVTQTYHIGSTFICEGQRIAVNGWEINDNNGDSFMEVSVEVDDEYIEDMLSKWYLLWLDSDGSEWIYHPTAHRDGELVFTDLHTTMIDENTPVWLLCEQYEQYNAVRQYISTTAVELN